MGQAKARGTFEQRVEQSKDKMRIKAEAAALKRKFEKEAESLRIDALPAEEQEKVPTGGRRTGLCTMRGNLILAATVASMSAFSNL